MSKKRNRRRFYPEFYTDEELGLHQNEENKTEVGDDAPVVPGETEILGEIEQPEEVETEKYSAENIDNVENIFDRTKNLNKNGVSNINKTENKSAPSSSQPLIYNYNPAELSETENSEINKLFEIVADNSPEPAREYNIIPFDREKAIEYARRWALDRNPNFYNFEELGGDCTNYISQILLAGGCRMDKSSALYGWYYNTANDKSPSWTGVEQLYNYLVKEKESGIAAKEIDSSMVEAGDIAQLSFNGKTFQHTPFIISVKRDALNNISFDRIKICAHSFDSDNRPLDTYQFKKIRFIRIIGHKEKINN